MLTVVVIITVSCNDENLYKEAVVIMSSWSGDNCDISSDNCDISRLRVIVTPAAMGVAMIL